MFGDQKTLARDLEALRIERQTEQGVTLHRTAECLASRQIALEDICPRNFFAPPSRESASQAAECAVPANIRVYRSGGHQGRVSG